uniref:Uncharacterized protein n=1 Tax=Photinus pyralis TaxID=7054 RepID=A0A1Y1NKJ6_PHOPY
MPDVVADIQYKVREELEMVTNLTTSFKYIGRENIRSKGSRCNYKFMSISVDICYCVQVNENSMFKVGRSRFSSTFKLLHVCVESFISTFSKCNYPTNAL